MGPQLDTHKRLAEAAEAMGRGSLTEAEEDCRSILAMFPRHYRALVLLGEILSRAGREVEAQIASDCAEMSKPGPTFRFTQFAMEQFRAAFGPPIPPRREIIQSNGRVQMRSLGQNGRFGNQLLQYAFVRLYAQQHNLVAEFPDWIGRDIFDFDDPFPSAKLASLDEAEADLFGSLQGRTTEVFADRDISGYFCGNTEEWRAWKSQFLALFEPGQKVRGSLAQALDKLRSRGKTIVAIHLRQGDYGYGRFWVAPSAWYVGWLRTLWPKLDRPVLYIASDLAAPHAEFADFSPVSADQLGVSISGADFLVDHHVLRHADHLAISNSSFSFTAAMLNAHAQSFLRPDPTLRKPVAFDPWASEVLWDAMVELQAVAAPERHLVQNQILPTDTVVHWGRYCSPWTNFARSVHGRLRIFETEGGASVTETLRKRKIRQVRLLVLEDAEILRKFLTKADDAFEQAQIDMVLFRLDAKSGAAGVSAEFSARGYSVFRFRKNALVRPAPYQSSGRGSYLAVRHGLPIPVQSGGSSPFYADAQNLLLRLSQWMRR
jgi:hypothetical protein